MELYVGIDVGKFKLDVHLNKKSVQFDNSKAGINKIIKLLQKEERKSFMIKLVVCEATGGYEANLAMQLNASNYHVHVAHPNKVRAFAKSQGKLAKTDSIDAAILSEYANTFSLTANYKPMPGGQVELRALLQRRNQLIDEKTREKNRLDKQLTLFSRKSIESHIKWIDKEVQSIQEEITTLIEQHPELEKSIELLKSIPGIGELTAATMLTAVPELGQIEDKKLAALVGVAPINHDSGKHKGKRQIKGGRAVIRKTLYMATIAGIRFNTVLKQNYQKLRSRGKPAKVAIVATMRKLLMIINSVFKRKTPWEKNQLKELT